MPYIGEGVVFRVKVNNSPLRPSDDFEGCLQAVCMARYIESKLFEEIAQSVMCVVFVVCEFRITVDLLLVRT